MRRPLRRDRVLRARSGTANDLLRRRLSKTLREFRELFANDEGKKRIVAAIASIS
jgi:hypothetical protein